MQLLERDILLKAEPEKVWDFLATPLNLNLLTPPSLEFNILTPVPEVMYDGLLIRYEIRIPGFGRRSWLTEIKHVRPGVGFVDEQRIGPYGFWYHQHSIEAAGSGQTRMIDRVTYRMPFGPLGTIVHALLVKKMLEEIFDYRAVRLHELFGAVQGGSDVGR